ncbi:hypothetical protein EJ02DRAFT_449180 [Clathrospora elynae]|uniref:Uncharacterized protein n=1 Tax=Clathrospora elynae TaxID=706981 RepID=A0A6A5T541_9PLEO|nr:hypothetical protein EJ02DRAFT_449180 [Clathrospora elynae]
MRKTLLGMAAEYYMNRLRNHTSIGRGDRPSYLLKIADHAHNTELTGLLIDCKIQYVSFDWRRTFLAFFQERHFFVRADSDLTPKIPYDEESELLIRRVNIEKPTHERLHPEQPARRKLLQPCVASNKHRMTPQESTAYQRPCARIKVLGNSMSTQTIGVSCDLVTLRLSKKISYRRGVLKIIQI